MNYPSIKVAYDPVYKHPLPPHHRFPMMKYELIPEQLIYEGTFEATEFFSPKPMTDTVIREVHDASYIRQLEEGTLPGREIRRIGFPYSIQLLKRELCIMFGTIQAAMSALDNGIAFNVAGGTHHAFSARGEGYCIYNDIAVGANYLLNQTPVKQILVVDLDVHQGNGTASIFANYDRVFTFSMHGEKNFPLHKESSDLDLPLPDGTKDNDYLALLRKHLPLLIEKVKPDFIFYQSGVDVLQSDKLGKLSITRTGCYLRDALVLENAEKYGIPLTAVMGGGYSESLREILEAHCNTYRLAKEIFE